MNLFLLCMYFAGITRFPDTSVIFVNGHTHTDINNTHTIQLIGLFGVCMQVWPLERNVTHMLTSMEIGLHYGVTSRFQTYTKTHIIARDSSFQLWPDNDYDKTSYKFHTHNGTECAHRLGVFVCVWL